jgi:predicted transcriptional regulator
MLPSTQEIKVRRKKLGLTQVQLARESGVSQSLIAKIESGVIDASYSNTVHIFDALERMERKNVFNAGQVMSSPVTYVHASDSVTSAIKLMKRKDYSQVPVFDGAHPVGSLSDKTILEKITSGLPLVELSKMSVSSVMEGSFPVVDVATPLPAVSSLLNYHFAAGIVTKANLLDLIGK